MRDVRGLIAAALIAIYAVATFGYDLSVTLCHCTQSDHLRTHHTHTCHNCHHSHSHDHSTDSDAVVAGSISAQPCNCSHDHSTDIDIYDKTRIVNPLAQPLICDAITYITPSQQSLSDLQKGKFYIDRVEQLPDSPDVAYSALRAPPVLA